MVRFIHGPQSTLAAFNDPHLTGAAMYQNTVTPNKEVGHIDPNVRKQDFGK